MKKQIMLKMIALFCIELIIFLPIYSAEIFADTDRTAPAISNIRAEPSSNSSDIKWDTDEEASSFVYYGLNKNVELMRFDVTMVLNHLMTLPFLDFNTLYYYKIKTCDNYENCASSSIYNFTTLNLPPPEKITGLMNSTVTARTISILWNESSAKYFSKYIIYRNDINIKNITGIKNTNLTDTGLISATTYKYQVAAFDQGNNEGEKSDALYITTLQPDLTAPVISNATVKQLTENSMKVSWNTDESSNSIINYGTSEAYGSNINSSELVTSHSLTLSPLQNGTLYYYEIQSCDIDENCDSYKENFVPGEDLVPPFINLNLPGYYNSYTVPVTGYVEPYSDVKFFVNTIYKGIVGKATSGSSGYINFSLSGFNVGENTVLVRAEDTAGNLNEKTYNVFIDVNPPEYVITGIPEFSPSKTLTINGSVNEPAVINIYVSKDVSDLNAPAKITGLKNESVKENSARISWNESKESDFDKYLIYRDNKLITTYQENSFTDIGLGANTTYKYEVAAIDKSCNTGAKSDSLYIKTLSGAVHETSKNISIDICSRKPAYTINLTEDKLKFSQTIQLDDGKNEIRVEITDIAGNIVSFKNSTFQDSSKPTFKYNNLAELTPSYIEDVTIKGQVSEKAKIYIYINDEDSFSIIRSRIANKTYSDIFDTDAEYRTETSKNGTFSIDVNLRRDPQYAHYDKDTEMYAQAATPSRWENKIMMIAIDEAGLVSDPIEQTIEYALCGSGGEWQVDIGDVMPAEIVPRYLIEGYAQFGFSLNLSWQGIGDEPATADKPVVSVGYRMGLSDLEKKNFDTKWVRGSPQVKCSGDNKLCYVLINFVKYDPSTGFGKKNWTMQEKEENLSQHNRGQCFKIEPTAFGEKLFSAKYAENAGCVKIPLTIKVNYPCERWREQGEYGFVSYTGTCSQETCLEADVLIQPRLDPAWIPEKLLESMISVMDKMIDMIDQVLEPLKSATEFALIGCAAMNIVWFVKKSLDFTSCIGVKLDECYANCNYDSGGITCSGQNSEKCKSCLDSKLTTQKVWWALHWVCDRVACPSVPSYEKYIKDNQKKDSACKEVKNDGKISSPASTDYKKLLNNEQQADPECKEVLNPPLANQKGKCCDEEYMQEWDSGCAFMNELKESACLASKGKDNDIEACGAWGNIFRGVADFSLCGGNDSVSTVNMKSDGQWFILERTEDDEAREEIDKFIETHPEYKGLEKWCLYLGREEITEKKDKTSGKIVEIVTEKTKVGGPILCTIGEYGEKKDSCENIKKNQIKEGKPGWPIYSKQPDQTFVVDIGDELKDKIPKYKDTAIQSSVQKAVPQSIVDQVCGGISGKDYVVDPTSGLLRSMQCGCLSGTYSYLKQYKQMLEIVRGCFKAILETGDGSPGICRAVISYYICDLIYYAISCVQEYSGSGSGVAIQDGIPGMMKWVAGAGKEVQQGVSGRYGNTNLYRVMFNEKKTLHAACVGAFTGDWSIDMESFISEAVEIPIRSQVTATATRRFMSYDATTGITNHVYRVGLLIISGADDLRYRVELICSNDNSCDSDEGFEGGMCDCARTRATGKREAGGEIPRDITSSFGNGHLDSGGVVNNEAFIQASRERFRYDKIRVTYTYKSNEGPKSEEEVFEIRQEGELPPAYCKIDLVDLGFKCSLFAPEIGQGYFSDYDDSSKMISIGRIEGKFYLNEGYNKVPFKYKVTSEGKYNDEPVKRWVSAVIKNHNKKEIFNQEYMISKEGGQQYTWPDFTVKKEYFTGGSGGVTVEWKVIQGMDSVSKVEKCSSQESYVLISYNNGWKMIGCSTNNIEECKKGNILGTCNLGGTTLTCNKNEQGNEEIAKIILLSNTLQNDKNILLQRTEKPITEGGDECAIYNENNPAPWTATFTLYDPKLDDNKAPTDQKGQIAYYQGIMQQYDVKFNVVCNTEKKETTTQQTTTSETPNGLVKV